MTAKKIDHKQIIRAADMVPFIAGWCSDTNKLVREIMGERSHYYDEGPMRYFRCRVQAYDVSACGTFMWTICRQDSNAQGDKGYIFVAHDFTGRCLTNSTDRKYHPTLEGARTERNEWLASVNPDEILSDALLRQRERKERELRSVREAIKMVTKGRRHA